MNNPDLKELGEFLTQHTALIFDAYERGRASARPLDYQGGDRYNLPPQQVYVRQLPASPTPPAPLSAPLAPPSVPPAPALPLALPPAASVNQTSPQQSYSSLVPCCVAIAILVFVLSLSRMVASPPAAGPTEEAAPAEEQVKPAAPLPSLPE